MTSIYFTEGGLDAHWGRSDSLVSTASSSGCGDSLFGSRLGSRWALLGDDDVFLPATVAIPRPCLPDLDLR